MKKIFLYSLLLFWWCLFFPNNYCNTNINKDILNYDGYSFFINDNEIRFRFLNF